MSVAWKMGEGWRFSRLTTDHLIMWVLLLCLIKVSRIMWCCLCTWNIDALDFFFGATFSLFQYANMYEFSKRHFPVLHVTVYVTRWTIHDLPHFTFFFLHSLPSGHGRCTREDNNARTKLGHAGGELYSSLIPTCTLLSGLDLKIHKFITDSFRRDAKGRQVSGGNYEQWISKEFFIIVS